MKNFLINKTRQHLYNTRGNSLDVPQVKTTTYGSNSFTLHAIRTWNFFQNKLSTTTSLPNLTQLKWHNSSNDIIYPNPGTTYTTMPNQNSTDITVTWLILLESSQLLFFVFLFIYLFTFYLFIFYYCYDYFSIWLCLFINDTDLNQCFGLFSSIYVQQS